LNPALLQEAVQQTAAAEQSYQKAIQLDSHSTAPVLGLANIYAEQRRWAEAERQYRKAMGVNPQAPGPRAALARLYLAEGQKGKAENILETAKRELTGDPDAYRLLGDFYVSTGNLDKAVAEYASLRQEHPKDLRVKKNYVQLLILNNRLDDATKLNDEILKRNVGDPDGLICRGQILIRQAHPNEAIAVLETALKSEPDNPTARYQLGLEFSLTGNLTRAESEWRAVVSQHPDAVDAQRALAEVAIRKGDFTLLGECAEALVKAQPSSPQGYILRATVRVARKDPAGAEVDLKKAIEVGPQSPLGYSRLGLLRVSEKRYAEAERLYEEALKLDPSFVEALQGLLGIYVRQKQPAKALARLNAQIAKVPNSPAYYVLQATLFIQTRNLENAEASLLKAADLNKNNAEALLMLGWVQEVRGSMDGAAASYRRLIQENPRDARSYVLLGALEEARDNWQEAEKLYQKALEIDPDYSLAGNNLAYVMLQHGGNIDVALSLAQAARLRMPEDPHVADTLAWAYCQKGAYATAIELLRQALQKVPANPTYHYHIGYAYEKSNDKMHAREHLKRALQLNPNYARGDEVRKALAELSGS